MAGRDDRKLWRVAEAVADRTPVDWEREGASHPDLRQRLGQLRALEAVSALSADSGRDPMVGKRLSHFHILGKLGEGGMGVVYRAEDEKLGRPVALKVLPPDLVASEERRLRFLREARAAGTLTHPSIATVYEAGEDQGIVFIALELVEGKTLRELIGRRPLPIKDALRIATAIAAGLAHAHQARVIHRDLKPDNVMLRPDEHVKILDFGLAKLLEEHADVGSSELDEPERIAGTMARAGKVMGTPGYMSPEQAQGQPLDARSDIFAFGITLYEMVTGGPPFRRETLEDTLGAILHDEPVPPSRVNPEAPQRLEEIIGKCLEKDPRERYQHADEVAVDLRKLQRVIEPALSPVPTPPPALPDIPARGWQRVMRRATHPVVLAASLLAVAAGGGVAWWQLRSPGQFESGDGLFVAEFENRTERRELGTAVRDAFEELLEESKFLRIIRGQPLAALVAAHAPGAEGDPAEALAERICGPSDCQGFLKGSVQRDDGGYRLQASLCRVGKRRCVKTVTAAAVGDAELLPAIYRMSLDLRRAAGEAEQMVLVSEPPTTNSLLAYQVFAALEETLSEADKPALCRRALEIDPDFVDAYRQLGFAYWNLGDFKRYREAQEEAYRRSSALPERKRLMIEIDSLDASYDFDAEHERLKVFRKIYPKHWRGPHLLLLLYSEIYEDMAAAQRAAEDAYRLWPNPVNLWNLCTLLWYQGKADEIGRLAAEAPQRPGSHSWSDHVLLWAHMIRGDEEKVRKTVEDLLASTPELRDDINRYFVTWLLATGRLQEASQVVRAGSGSPDLPASPSLHFRNGIIREWLEWRQTGGRRRASLDWMMKAGDNPRLLHRVVTFHADTAQVGILPLLVAKHQEEHGSSGSRFVREEIQFARGCLALIRREANTALGLHRPLAMDSKLRRRHRMLGRAYEQLGLWREAAAEYEQVLENPHLKWDLSDIPAVQVLEEFRLAGIYERLGDRDRARHWYERFLADWKDADPDIPELIEVRKRLAALTSHQAASR